ncbi:MAG TPA: SAM-dependent methyltransferase, partial [Nitrospiria bacterium]|nr:SAM-dependent methyltransferase [Nitrospiria bacterium]
MSDASDHEPAVIALIRADIAARGPITFARFMDLALYAPGAGYYMRDADRIGARGDFYTSGNLHALFGESVARQIEEMASRVGEDSFTVIEPGAGRGALAFDVLNVLSRAPHRTAFRYVIVEKSPAMIARQRRLLAPWLDSGVLSWADALP